MMHHKNDFTIMSLNVWYGELQQELRAYVAQHKATVSVFCFQETDTPTLAMLDALLKPGFTRYSMRRSIVGEADEFYATTYVREDVTVTGTAELLCDIPHAGVGLVCELQVSPKHRLRVVNVHGQPRPGHKLDTPERIAQSKGLLRYAAHDDIPTVFMGDFNLLPEAHSVKLFTAAGYRDLISDYAIATTRNQHAWQRYPDNQQLYADYAFTRLTGMYECDFGVEDVGASDHLPLVLTLRHAPPLQ